MEMKSVLGGGAGFVTEVTVGADVTKAQLSQLEADTEYLVRVVAHRKNAKKTGISESLEMKTTKGVYVNIYS